MLSGRDASLTQDRGHTSRLGSPSAGIFGIMVYSARWPAEGDPRATEFDGVLLAAQPRGHDAYIFFRQTLPAPWLAEYPAR